MQAIHGRQACSLHPDEMAELARGYMCDGRFDREADRPKQVDRVVLAGVDEILQAREFRQKFGKHQTGDLAKVVRLLPELLTRQQPEAADLEIVRLGCHTPQGTGSTRRVARRPDLRAGST